MWDGLPRAFGELLKRFAFYVECCVVWCCVGSFPGECWEDVGVVHVYGRCEAEAVGVDYCVCFSVFVAWFCPLVVVCVRPYKHSKVFDVGLEGDVVEEWYVFLYVFVDFLLALCGEAK